MNDLIKPSRIFPKKQREIRNLTRFHEQLVNNRTMLKNRVHRVLEPELRNAIQHNLESSQILIIDQCLSLIEQITCRIDELDEEIGAQMHDREKDLKIATSIPGIGKVSAMTILAEIGNYEEFVTPEKLAA